MSHHRFMRRAAKGLLFSSIAFSASSYASSYYNCANATGCVAVTTLTATSNSVSYTHLTLPTIYSV